MVGGWSDSVQVKAILVARNKNPTVLRKGAGMTEDTAGHLAVLTDIQAS